MSTATPVFTGTPQQVLEAVVEGINTGNFDLLMALYEPDAAFRDSAWKPRSRFKRDM
jgi:hypothetical protein